MLPPRTRAAWRCMHIAMFEAVNAIERRYAPYRLNLTAERTCIERGGGRGGGARRADGAASRRAGGASMQLLRPRSQQYPMATPRRLAMALGKKAAAEILAMARQGRRDRAGNLSSAHHRGRLRPDRDPGQLDLRPCHAVGDELRRAIPPGAAAGAELRDLGAGRQRDQGVWRPHQLQAKRRADRYRSASGS